MLNGYSQLGYGYINATQIRKCSCSSCETCQAAAAVIIDLIFFSWLFVRVRLIMKNDPNAKTFGMLYGHWMWSTKKSCIKSVKNFRSCRRREFGLVPWTPMRILHTVVRLLNRRMLIRGSMKGRVRRSSSKSPSMTHVQSISQVARSHWTRVRYANGKLLSYKKHSRARNFATRIQEYLHINFAQFMRIKEQIQGLALPLLW